MIRLLCRGRAHAGHERRVLDIDTMDGIGQILTDTDRSARGVCVGYDSHSLSLRLKFCEIRGREGITARVLDQLLNGARYIRWAADGLRRPWSRRLRSGRGNGLDVLPGLLHRVVSLSFPERHHVPRRGHGELFGRVPDLYRVVPNRLSQC